MLKAITSRQVTNRVTSRGEEIEVPQNPTTTVDPTKIIVGKEEMDPTKVSIDRVERRAEAAVAEDDYPIEIDFDTIEVKTETTSANMDHLVAIMATRIDT
jgi:hypothetical protein